VTVDELRTTVLAPDLEEMREEIQSLIEAATTEVYGVSFIDDPVGFVLAVIIDWFVGLTEAIAGQLGVSFLVIWEQLTLVLTSSGRALLVPFAVLGDLFLGGLSDVNGLLIGLASAAGPLSPFVLMGFWFAIAYVLLRVGSVALSRGLPVVAGVIPWL